MARPKKQPVESVEVVEEAIEDVTQQEKPPAQTIEVPYLDVQSQIMGQALNAARAAKEAEEKKKLQELAEKEAEEQKPDPPLVVWDMETQEEEKPKQYYGVYDRGSLLFVTEAESPKIDECLAENKAQLDYWIADLALEVTDENHIMYMNCPKNGQNYSSYAQYLSQQGLAPSPPKFNNWLDYYRNEYNGISDEEIALKVNGNLRFSFSPVKLL
jgi:hypothetical protein